MRIFLLLWCPVRHVRLTIGLLTPDIKAFNILETSLLFNVLYFIKYNSIVLPNHIYSRYCVNERANHDLCHHCLLLLLPLW
jgi:hypothetical protein